MSKLNSLQELKEKWCYRLWRVVFLFFYFISLVFGIALTYEAHKPLTPKLEKSYTYDELVKLGATPVDFSKYGASISTNKDLKQEELNEPLTKRWFSGWVKIIGNSILVFWSITLVFEIIRSAFNYIFSGKYFPPAWFTFLQKYSKGKGTRIEYAAEEIREMDEMMEESVESLRRSTSSE